MNPSHSAIELMAKATRARESAKLLLASGDVDGACNRAYYAMFDAARAALIAIGAAVGPDIGKTHSRLIAAFGLHIVKTGLVSVELGRVLNWADELRLIADYRGDSVESQDAEAIVQDAGRFLMAIKTLVVETTESNRKT